MKAVSQVCMSLCHVYLTEVYSQDLVLVVWRSFLFWRRRGHGDDPDEAAASEEAEHTGVAAEPNKVNVDVSCTYLSYSI